MGATIHPHKGYLNTNFNVHVKGHEEEYSVYQKGDCDKCSITTGIVRPNEPHVLNIAQPGDYVVSFSDSDEINIHIEDGYKFGGSTYKTSFIFDDCPWCFVVMHDRTYFYNRETKRSFVESISPDKITEINEDFVIFENDKQEERTIFSLVEEKPILCISDIVTFNERVVVWEECSDNKSELCIYVLGTEPNAIDRFVFDGYIIDNENDSIIFYNGNIIKKFSLSEYNGSTTYQITIRGTLVNVVAPNLAVSYRELHNRNELIIRNLDKDEETTITLDGYLAEINGEELVDIWRSHKRINEFDFSAIDVPGLTLSAQYNKVFIYPCKWDVFYSIETISLEKKYGKSIIRTSKSKLCSANSDKEISIQQAEGNLVSYGNAICFYNHVESYVRSEKYEGGGYCKGGAIYPRGNNIYMYNDSCLYKLSRNGYWDDKREINLDFSRFGEFGIVKDKEIGICQTLSGINLGKWKCEVSYNSRKYIKTSENYIFPGGQRIKTTDLEVPNSLSESLKLGLSVASDEVCICNLKGVKYTSERIMEDVYDSTEYHDVLLSEDGNCIMHKDGDKAITFDIGTGFSQTYANMSYIKHINGIRPLFAIPTSLQPVLVNPVTKQRIDANEMSNFQFVSPDGKLYADTRLKEYIEHYDLETGALVSNDEFRELRAKYTYPWNEKRGSTAWEIITENRKQLILEHFEYLNEKYPKLFKDDLTGNKWADSVLDTKDSFDVEHFLGRLYGERGIAIIRKSNDDSEYSRIDLGSPLMYINYVSFSYDSKYVAIAGYRNSGGLFLVYDLETKSTIVHEDTSRAVWNVAFSAINALASYTSNPKTLFAANKEEYINMCDRDRIIEGHNFLTFSPDGMYFALSQQGYISKYDINGNVRDNWGHQPSSLVDIRSVHSQENTLTEFSDLGDSGISETSRRTSVASVSFSNDNKRLMMVGNDGVVIIRNLHLENYASK